MLKRQNTRYQLQRPRPSAKVAEMPFGRGDGDRFLSGAEGVVDTLCFCGVGGSATQSVGVDVADLLWSAPCPAQNML